MKKQLVFLLLIVFVVHSESFSQRINFATGKCPPSVEAKEEVRKTDVYMREAFKENGYIPKSLFYRKANYMYCAGESKDSIKFYLEKAFEMDLQWTCFATANMKTQKAKRNWVNFAEEVSEDYWKEVCAKCEYYFDVFDGKTKIEEKVIENPNTVYIQALKEISGRDQKYRVDKNGNAVKDLSMTPQESMDSLNRVELNRLYEEFGFPLKEEVGTNQEAVWFVIQHSTDCEWNKKWIIRYIDAYQEGKVEPYYMDRTFERFFHPENGFCKSNTGYFIEYLKCKYPDDYQKKFGYKDF